MHSPSAQSDQQDEPDLRANFLRMSIYFAIGHGCATTPLVYASSILDSQVAYLGNGTLYIAMLLSALILAVPITSRTGLKGGMVAAFVLYAVYAAGFSAAAMAAAPALQGVFFVLGSMSGGLAAGILWTAQGGFMARTASAIADTENEPHQLVNSELATQFAFYYLLFEEVAKVLFTCMMSAGISAGISSWLYVLLSVASAFAMSQVVDFEPPAEMQEKLVSAKLLATFSLWSDLRIWLLSPTNITFGVAAAYMNGYFNANIGSKVLGAKNIGILSAITVLVSVCMTRLYGVFGQRYGNLVPISIGAASFACMALLMLATSCCQEWGWWIVIFYALQGSGRAVYESTNRAVFADTFKGSDIEAAFANCILQMALSSAICFFASAYVQGQRLEIALLILALLTPVAYIAKTHLDAHISPEADPLLLKSA